MREELMRQAIALAVENVDSGRGGPFGSVIARGGQVIATGVNLVTATSDPTAHAEIVAIRRACAALGVHQLAGCELFASCEPCPMCLGAIYWARPERYFFAAARDDASEAGFDDTLIYDQIALPPPARRIPGSQLLEGEGRAPFAAWLSSAAKRPY